MVLYSGLIIKNRRLSRTSLQSATAAVVYSKCNPVMPLGLISSGFSSVRVTPLFAASTVFFSPYRFPSIDFPAIERVPEKDKQGVFSRTGLWRGPISGLPKSTVLRLPLAQRALPVLSVALELAILPNQDVDGSLLLSLAKAQLSVPLLRGGRHACPRPARLGGGSKGGGSGGGGDGSGIGAGTSPYADAVAAAVDAAAAAVATSAAVIGGTTGDGKKNPGGHAPAAADDGDTTGDVKKSPGSHAPAAAVVGDTTGDSKKHPGGHAPATAVISDTTRDGKKHPGGQAPAAAVVDDTTGDGKKSPGVHASTAAISADVAGAGDSSNSKEQDAGGDAGGAGAAVQSSLVNKTEGPDESVAAAVAAAAAASAAPLPVAQAGEGKDEKQLPPAKQSPSAATPAAASSSGKGNDQQPKEEPEPEPEPEPETWGLDTDAITLLAPAADGAGGGGDGVSGGRRGSAERRRLARAALRAGDLDRLLLCLGRLEGEAPPVEGGRADRFDDPAAVPERVRRRAAMDKDGALPVEVRHLAGSLGGGRGG